MSVAEWWLLVNRTSLFGLDCLIHDHLCSYSQILHCTVRQML